MLNVMRRHAKYFYVLFVIVILTFMFWGVGTIDNSTVQPLAEVGREKIATEEYWRAFDRVSNLYREIYKDKFDEEMQKKLKQKVLESLIEERILIAAAQDAGIAVSDRELEDAITHDPTFTRDGAFNREIYLRTLELNRLTPTQYEAAKRQEIMLEKMRNLIASSVELTPAESAKAGEGEMAEQALEEKKRAALLSYVNGLKKKLSIKVNMELIS